MFNLKDNNKAPTKDIKSNNITNQNNTTNNQNNKLSTSLSLHKNKREIPDNDDNEFLKNFIEIQKDNLDQLQKNDFIRYRNKTDGELKKGGYVVDIYNKVLKSGEEKIYIKLSFNKTFINAGRVGTFPISLDNLDKIYKRIENKIEYGIVSDSINGISENFGSDINNIYETLRNNNLEISSLRDEVEELKKENIKTEVRLKKIVGYIKEISDKISPQ